MTFCRPMSFLLLADIFDFIAFGGLLLLFCLFAVPIFCKFFSTLGTICPIPLVFIIIIIVIITIIIILNPSSLTRIYVPSF